MFDFGNNAVFPTGIMLFALVHDRSEAVATQIETSMFP